MFHEFAPELQRVLAGVPQELLHEQPEPAQEVLRLRLAGYDRAFSRTVSEKQ